MHEGRLPAGYLKRKSFFFKNIRDNLMLIMGSVKNGKIGEIGKGIIILSMQMPQLGMLKHVKNDSQVSDY